MSKHIQENKPLAGLRILDLSSVLMGPFATSFLAERGAEVIKVEAVYGDPSRRLGDSPRPNMAAIFRHLNRGKQSIVLDLKKKEGIEVIMRLLPTVDALVYSIRPNAMRRLGLSYDDVNKINEKIIYCGVSGFDERGQYAGKPALDDVIQGACGIPDLMSRAGDGTPRYIPMAVADRIVGLYAATALLTALLGRERRGKGYEINVPMFESMTHFIMTEHMHMRSFPSRNECAGNPRTLDNNRKPFKTLDGYISVLPYTDKHWADTFRLIDGVEYLSDPRFLTLMDRVKNTKELYGILSARLLTRTSDDWLNIFSASDIPVMKINTIDDLINDPHLKEVKFFQNTGVDEEQFISMRSPIYWGGESDRATGAAPELGEHTEEILRSAGYNDDEVAVLIQQGVTK